MAELTRNPTSDEAVSGTWTGTPGSRFAVVDDYPDTTGADFITCSAVGALTFGFSAFAVPTGSTGITVFVDYYDLKNGSQSCAIAGRLKCGASYFNSSTHNPTNATWVQRTDTFANNPATAAAWTVDQVNGIGSNALAAFGVNVSDASPSISLSSIRVRVQYTPPAQNFDGTITSATFAALAPTFEPGNANFDASVASGTFSALNPTFESVADIDTSPPVASFTALDVTFEATTGDDFDVTPPTATFAALDPTLETVADFDVNAPAATFTALDPTLGAVADFDVNAPAATFTALDPIFEAVGPQEFDVAAAMLSAGALNVVFAGPSPPAPTVARGGKGGGGLPLRRETTYEERLLETLERIDSRLEKLEEPKHERRNRFLLGSATVLIGIIARKMNQ